jgi:beta-glucosidase
MSTEVRVNGLMSQLTLKEKIGLLNFESQAVDRLGIPAYNWWNECLHGVARAGLVTVFPQAIGLGATWDTDLMCDVASVISDEERVKYYDFLTKDKRGK